MNDLYLSFLFELEIWLLSFDFFNNQACRQKDRRTASNQFVPKTKESTFLATLVTQRRIQKKGFRTIHLLTSEMHKTWQTTCNPFQTRIRFGLKQAFVLLKWLSTRVKHIFFANTFSKLFPLPCGKFVFPIKYIGHLMFHEILPFLEVRL